jgi:NAD-dependent DNA ligase
MIRGLFAALKMEQLQEFKKLSEMIEDMDRHYYNEEPPSEEDECG